MQLLKGTVVQKVSSEKWVLLSYSSQGISVSD